MRYFVFILSMICIIPIVNAGQKSTTAAQMRAKYNVRDLSFEEQRNLHDTMGHNKTRKKSKKNGFFTKLHHNLWVCDASCARHDVYKVLRHCVLTEQKHPKCLNNLAVSIQDKDYQTKFYRTLEQDVKVPKHIEQIESLIEARRAFINDKKQTGEWEHNKDMLEKEQRVQILINNPRT